jgi:hypothetical protein
MKAKTHPVRQCMGVDELLVLSSIGKTLATLSCDPPDMICPVCCVTMPRNASRGMIQVGGVTYRIERLERHCYTVVRLLDDLQLGTFRTMPSLRLHPTQLDFHLFRDIVRVALRSARTSAVMHVAPVCAPDEEAAPRTPSTMPPRAALA